MVGLAGQVVIALVSPDEPWKGYLVLAGWVAIGVSILILILTLQPVQDRLPVWFQRLAGPELNVTITQEEWDTYSPKACILEVFVSIENRTRHTKKLSDFDIRYSSGEHRSLEIGAMKEAGRREQGRQSLRRTSIVEPSQTVQGWLAFVLIVPAVTGRPMYRLVVVDELNVPYEGRRSFRLRPLGGRSRERH